jgi:hypothetical protein
MLYWSLKWRRKREARKIFKEIMIENFPYLGRKFVSRFMKPNKFQVD